MNGSRCGGFRAHATSHACCRRDGARRGSADTESTRQGRCVEEEEGTTAKVSFDVSQLLRGWLKEVAPEKVPCVWPRGPGDEPQTQARPHVR